MSFHFRCPACNAKLEAEDDWTGLETACPKCSQTITIAPDTTSKKTRIQLTSTTSQTLTEAQQQVSTLPHPPKNPSASDKFPFICPSCGTLTELDAEQEGQEYECPACCEISVAKPATEKRCPHCGELIKIQASICKFCKKSVIVSQKGVTVEKIQIALTFLQQRIFPKVKNFISTKKKLSIGIAAFLLIAVLAATFLGSCSSGARASKQYTGDSSPKSGHIKVTSMTPAFKGILKAECCLNGSVVATQTKRWDGNLTQELNVDFKIKATEGDYCSIQYSLMNRFGGVSDSAESKSVKVTASDIMEGSLRIYN